MQISVIEVEMYIVQYVMPICTMGILVLALFPKGGGVLPQILDRGVL